jgi:hypothetical protein
VKRTPLKRSTPIARKSKLTAKRRTASDYKRVYGSRARVAWVKSLPCFACWEFGEIHNAHITTGGTGRKANADQIIPLCSDCHGLQHRKGWAAIGLDLEERLMLAAVVEEGWRARQ